MTVQPRLFTLSLSLIPQLCSPKFDPIPKIPSAAAQEVILYQHLSPSYHNSLELGLCMVWAGFFSDDPACSFHTLQFGKPGNTNVLYRKQNK